MVTLPVVFVSNQGSMIWDDWSFCIQNKTENPLHHMVAYLCMMQQNIDTICSISGYTRRALCCLSVCSTTLKSFSMNLSDGLVHVWNDAVIWSSHREAHSPLFNWNLHHRLLHFRIYIRFHRLLSLDMIHIWITVLTFCMPAWCLYFFSSLFSYLQVAWTL